MNFQCRQYELIQVFMMRSRVLRGEGILKGRDNLGDIGIDAWENIIKPNLIGWKSVGWIHLAQDNSGKFLDQLSN
jgi:hypothetical protein